MKKLGVDEIYKSGAIPMEVSGSFTSEIFDTSFITGNLILEWLVNGEGGMQITLLASSDGVIFTAAPAPIAVNQTKSNGLSKAIFSLPAGSIQIQIQFKETGMAPISVVYSLRAANAIDTDGTMSNNSDSLIPSQKAVKTYVDNAISDAGLTHPLQYEGIIDCSTNPNYPAANAGYVYVVSVGGKIGGSSGVVVIAGDLILCKTDSSAAGNQAAVGANWDILEKGIDLTNIAITGGSIDGTPIGATTPAAGTFTTLKGKSDEIIIAATGSLSAAQMLGQIINNYGQAADVTLNIAAASKGEKFTIILGTTVAKAFDIAPAAGDSIYVAGVTTGAGKYLGIASAVIGATVKFEAFQTGAGTYSWNATVISGTWVAQS
jgi:hypothetical protein